MEIRKSTAEDMDAIMEIFASAKAFMRAHGNKTQWEDGYPGRDILETDIRNGNSYVMVENGHIAGTFSLILGVEPTYQVIKGGAWHSDEPYGTIHRIASDGTARGIAQSCFAYSLKQIDYLRIDTHKDNLPMQAAIEKFGFRKCGIICVRDGSERIAFDYRKNMF